MNSISANAWQSRELSRPICYSSKVLWLSILLLLGDSLVIVNSAVTSPTLKPVAKPTNGTVVEHEISTSAPASKPTPAPVSRPVTVSPTRKPVPKPSTTSPSVVAKPPPTRKPTFRPTIRPSTQRPSRAPQKAPTTRRPTLKPRPPSHPPTLRPSSKPSRMKSLRPTLSPSRSPSRTPSAKPSLSYQQYDITLDWDMILLCKMDSQKPSFEKAAAEHILQSIDSTDFGNYPLVNVRVVANVSDQQSKEGIACGNLQTVNVTTNVSMVFQSQKTRTKAQIQTLIKNAFSSDKDRKAFVDRAYNIDGKSDFFASATLIQVKVEGVAPDGANGSSASSAAPIAMIAGAAAGGSLALIALALLFLRRSKTFHSVGTPEDEAEEESRSRQSQPVGQIGLTTEIVVERQDDISTLGDPVLGHSGMMTGLAERDEQTASVGNDYDYTKQYLKAQGLSSLGDLDRVSSTGSRSASTFDLLGKSSASQSSAKLGGLFSDEASYDQRFGDDKLLVKFEVEVPPGKLGMVIDTPNGGVPVVHALKAESALSAKVKVGDRLVAVDGDDVTCMSAVQVSKLISLKSDQRRVLAFVRGRDLGDNS